MAKINIREKVLNAKDISFEDVPVPEWDVTIRVKALTGKARAQLLKSVINPDNGTMDFEKMYPELVIGTSFDPEDDKPIFELADRDMLNEKSGLPLERIALVAMRLSGLSKNAVNEQVKN